MKNYKNAVLAYATTIEIFYAQRKFSAHKKKRIRSNTKITREIQKTGHLYIRLRRFLAHP